MNKQLSKIETELGYLHMCVWSGGTFNEEYFNAYKKMVNKYRQCGVPIRDEHDIYIQRYEKEAKMAQNKDNMPNKNNLIRRIEK